MFLSIFLNKRVTYASISWCDLIRTLSISFYIFPMLINQKDLIILRIIYVFMYPEPVASTRRYREIWHLRCVCPKCTTFVIQLRQVSESEEEPFVVRKERKGDGGSGWFKLRRQNELSHRKKRSVSLTSTDTFHLEVRNGSKIARRWTPRDPLAYISLSLSQIRSIVRERIHYGR